MSKAGAFVVWSQEDGEHPSVFGNHYDPITSSHDREEQGALLRDRAVFGERALVQVHKRRNVEDHLPESMKLTIGRALSKAYRSRDPQRAERLLEVSLVSSNGSICKPQRRCAKD